jgi:hypothetical protein
MHPAIQPADSTLFCSLGEALIAALAQPRRGVGGNAEDDIIFAQHTAQNLSHSTNCNAQRTAAAAAAAATHDDTDELNQAHATQDECSEQLA